MTKTLSRSRTCGGRARKLVLNPLVRSLSLGSVVKDNRLEVFDRLKRKRISERRAEREPTSVIRDASPLVEGYKDDGSRTDKGTTFKDTRPVTRKPFRDPRSRIRRTPRNHSSVAALEQELARLTDGERILRNCMVQKVTKATEKWVEAGREAAEYLWKLVGQEIPTESKTGFGQMDGWGFEQPKSEKWVAEEENFDLTDDEDLPSIDEVMGQRGSLRRYGANGLASDHHTCATTALSTVSVLDGETPLNLKKERNVGWMMEQMGIEPSLFGWKDHQDDWEP